MSKSDSIGSLAAALSKAQAEIKPAPMTAVNPFFKSKYADLGSVIEVSRQPLAKNGLSVSQLISGEGGSVSVETMLLHESGEWISTTITLPVKEERSLAQASGSVITYLRRYAYAAILGIYADEDTDAEKKTDAKPEPKPAAKPIPPAIAKVAAETGATVTEGEWLPEAPIEPPSATMELATAEAVATVKGEAYGSLDDVRLQNMARSIRKMMDGRGKEKLTDDEAAEYQYKLDAILTILRNRHPEGA